MRVSEIIKPEKNYQRAGLIIRASVMFGMGYRAPNFSFFVFFFFFLSFIRSIVLYVYLFNYLLTIYIKSKKTYE
jgi:hypothetical protein